MRRSPTWSTSTWLAVMALLLSLLAVSATAHAGRAEARALTAAGERLEAEGDARAALASYREAIADEPGYLPAIDRAIPLWIAAGELDALVAVVERATLRRPDYARGWYALAYAYRNLGRDRSAVLAYDAYLAMRPGDADAIFGLAMAELALGHGDAAAHALRRYLAIERRPERAAFVERARDELGRLGVADPTSPRLAQMIRELVAWLRGELALRAPARDASPAR